MASKSESVAWEGDPYSQVMGKDKDGYVRGLGLGPTPKKVWGYTSRKWETSRNISDKGYTSRREYASVVGEVAHRKAWLQGVEKGTQLHSWEKTMTSDSVPGKQPECGRVVTDVSPPATSQTSQPVSTAVAPADSSSNKTEKVWHYRDPSGKVQGPFSMVQLRKWSKNGFFPADLKIWRTSQNEDDSILLTEALAGKFQKEPSLVGGSTSEAVGVQSSHLLQANTLKSYGSVSQPGNRGQGTEMLRVYQNCGSGNASSNMVSSSQSQLVVGKSLAAITSKGLAASSLVETSKFSASVHGPDSGGKYDSSNLPSPTPTLNAMGWTGKPNYKSR
ncbi:hypothetical protein Ancab_027370 [Ancistrocladus abbreviatus]